MQRPEQESEHIKYTKGFKYQLEEAAWFITDVIGCAAKSKHMELFDDGWLYIHEGYAWDGASGPTVDTKSSMRGSLVHDALYQLMRLEKIDKHWRDEADYELYKRCIADHMWRWRATLWRKLVMKYASSAAHPDNKRKLYTAP